MCICLTGPKFVLYRLGDNQGLGFSVFHSTSPLQSSIKLAFPRRYEMGVFPSVTGEIPYSKVMFWGFLFPIRNLWFPIKVQLNSQRKRFRVRNLSKDISPISIRALMNSHHPYGTMAVQLQYPMKRFSTFCRVGLPRSLSRIGHVRSLKVEILLNMYTRSVLPLVRTWVTSWPN